MRHPKSIKLISFGAKRLNRKAALRVGGFLGL
jgi:hypothetical protein